MGRTLIAVVDLEDYEVVLTNATEDNHDFLDLTVTPLTEEEAPRRIGESPHLLESLYQGKEHQPGSYSFEDGVLRMQLMADCRLVAAGEVRERNRPRLQSSWLERNPTI